MATVPEVFDNKLRRCNTNLTQCLRVYASGAPSNKSSFIQGIVRNPRWKIHKNTKLEIMRLRCRCHGNQISMDAIALNVWGEDQGSAEFLTTPWKCCFNSDVMASNAWTRKELKNSWILTFWSPLTHLDPFLIIKFLLEFLYWHRN